MYRNQSVTLKYGNIRNYKIEEIDWSQNPKSTFLMMDVNGNINGGSGDRDGDADGEISYIDYYYKHYGIKIED